MDWKPVKESDQNKSNKTHYRLNLEIHAINAWIERSKDKRLKEIILTKNPHKTALSTGR